MLNITLTIHRNGDAATVTAGPSTQVAFEREHNVGIAKIAEEQKVSHIYWLAWHAAKPGVGFDDWLESIDSVEVEIEAPDPTQPTAPDGS